MRGAILAAAAALAFASPAVAQPAAAPVVGPLEELRRYCLQAAGFDAGLRQAEADGWMTLPDAMMRQRARMFTRAEGRMRTTREGMTLLLVGEGRIPFGNQTADVDMCFVGEQPADHRELEGAMRTWMGRRPTAGRDPAIWAWVETPEGRRSIDRLGNRQAEAVLRDGTMRVMMVGRSGEMSMVGYALPRLTGRGPTGPERSRGL